jgi:hypothetical protein
MKVPSFKTEKLREDIFALADVAPTRDMYKLILVSIDSAMDELVQLRSTISTSKDSVRSALRSWDLAFQNFGEREAFYYDAFLNSKDRIVVDKPLFKADYSEFEFASVPGWADIETPWRLANDLATIAVAAGADQDSMTGIGKKFEQIVQDFWLEANARVVKVKAVYEKLVLNESPNPMKDGGLVMGFWPIVAVGAVALVGAMGTATLYTVANSSTPEKYVEEKPWEKHLKTAKSVGIGVVIGVTLAVILMLRIGK